MNVQKSKQLRDCISNAHLSGTGRSSLPCRLPGVFHNQAAAGTWGSKALQPPKWLTATCSATGPVLPAKCQRSLQSFRKPWLSQCEVLLTSQTSPELQTFSGPLLWTGVLIGFPDISPALPDLPRLEVKSSFMKLNLCDRLPASFSITQHHVELNKKDLVTINLNEENKQRLLSSNIQWKLSCME